ncbi:helix-turn-helix transcriptional regulator [Sphingorhabdus sp. SMR4y]|uniref:helix-turn-helix transcriptional regulator n=1 Tax=Sphingorhabdus sp. SMR4y TaxID=2584094 RepID=UPI000B61AC78|nr:helix-turn-helix transcriptional regulator [Sphingorhabdus sp. SMR4y]ASK89924.1 LuxR family transcriptional regulator [Sphingorhabdus sp. SMR4y]
MTDRKQQPKHKDSQVDYLRPFLNQFRGDGVKISSEPIWSERVEEIIANLPAETLDGIVSRIRQSSENQIVDFAAFGEAHGLTPAEIKLVDSIVGGLSVPEHAECHGISVNTARVHMQRVLEKTGSRRQTDLLRKVLGH